jgi:K+-sensing histidine kinase KdpD
VAARSRARWADITAYLAAIGGPALLTAGLVAIGASQREYVFLYMALVASIAVFRGLVPSLLAAAVSFFLVVYFLIPPVGTLTIANRQDLVNLLVFFGTAGLVGFLASRRRQTLVRAEALTQQLQQLNAELIRLNQEQAEAAQALFAWPGPSSKSSCCNRTSSTIETCWPACRTICAPRSAAS